MTRKRKSEFHETFLPECLKCSSDSRNQNTTSSGFCKITKGADALGIKCVGNWGREKVYAVSQYLGIFADSMKGKYDHLNYLEVCSGPGRCATRNGSEMDGTSMCFLSHFAVRHFSSAVFIDNDPKSVEILTKRIEKVHPPIPAFSCVGDYNDLSSISAAIDRLNLNGNTLSLCVLDPYDCSMPFEVIRYIKNRLGKADFIISFFDGLDAKRNLKTAIKALNVDELERFAKFLGFSSDEMKRFISSEEVKSSLTKPSTRELMALFASRYEESLRKIGLPLCNYRPIKRDIDGGVEYYKLLFATASKLALKFWREIGAYTSTGQAQFSFIEDCK